MMRFSIFTLGCKVNTYESDAVRELLLEEKWIEGGSGEKVDVVIINTCVVTSTAEQKSRQHIRRFRRANPDAVLVAMGCYSQREGGELLATCGADIVIGTSRRKLVVSHIEAFLADRTPIVDVEGEPRHSKYEEIGSILQPFTSRAFVKIQDGCDNYCSYCIIPYVRGRSRSREPQKIVEEIRNLVQRDYKEIVIAGIHTGGYGKDLADSSLSKLIADILQEIPQLFRLRISSIEETEIDDDLIALLKKYPNIADHLHIPVQSGSEAVLRRMNRKYHIADFKRKVDAIRCARPDIAITTDVIVGFPGETDDELRETCAFIEDVHFSELHVFPFSKRDGTPAAKMANQVSDAVKKQRVKTLLSLSRVLHQEYAEKFIGRELEVLFEDYDEACATYRGHTSNYLEVHLASKNDLRSQVRKVAYSGVEGKR